MQRYKNNFIPPNNLSEFIENSGYSNALSYALGLFFPSMILRCSSVPKSVQSRWKVGEEGIL